jgi:ABC-2 type transport system ATP-binding protein
MSTAAVIPRVVAGATAAGAPGPAAAAAVKPAAVVPVLAMERLHLKAPDGFSLDLGPWALAPGQRLGLIGRNGAGKSTLLEALSGLRDVTFAEGQLLGHPWRELHREPALRLELGVLLQQVEFSAYTRVRELLALHAVLYGPPWPQLHQRLGMAELAPLRARTLSRGQRQRLLLCLALSHRPTLAFLDEPLTGLDRRYVDALGEVLNGPELANTAMLIVGHTPEELALCQGFLWLHEGRLADQGDQATLLQRHLAPHRALVQAATQAEIEDLVAAVAAADLGLQRVERPQPKSVLLFSREPLAARLAALAPAGGWPGLEVGRSQMGDLLRAGPRSAALATPGVLH